MREFGFVYVYVNKNGLVVIFTCKEGSKGFYRDLKKQRWMVMGMGMGMGMGKESKEEELFVASYLLPATSNVQVIHR
ncbi:hypothetical protein LguiA_020911 [Lonicera macranthoides]